MAFEHQVVVRFFEIDRAGIVFFARFFEYCHVTYEELMAKIFGSGEAFFQSSPWGTPLVHAESDYFRPARMGDRLTIRLEVERLGGSSITLAFSIFNGDVLCAKIKHVHAVIDRSTFKPRTVPTELLDGLRRLQLIA